MQPEIARILDANLNRAREGLRVAEDFARFVVEDRRLAEQAKLFRHALADAARALEASGGKPLLSARDTAGDVGTDIRTDSEVTRAAPAAVATAAAKRVGEALRVLCEFAKLAEPRVAEQLDQLRYRFYDWEKWLATAGDRGRIRRAKVYLLLSQRLCRGGDWRSAARAAIDGGVDVIQLREKDLPDGQLLDRAAWLVELCRAAGVLSVINDRPDIAKLAGADGVHVGRDDLPAPAARRIVRATQFVGTSTHAPDQLEDAIAANADYIALGPMFPTSTKPDYAVAGVEYARAGIARLDGLGIPHVAVGGITPANAAQLAAAGVRCVAVSSAILCAEDIPAAVRAIREATQ
jgi:thiamine-phosphate pyrophosphorylase